MNLVQPGMESIRFISSPESELPEDRDLLTVSYKRVQKASPEFSTVYEDMDQSIDIRISTFIFRAAPEPVLTLYDFVMTTFVPQSNVQALEKPDSQDHDVNALAPIPQTTTDQLRVILKLASVQGQYLCLASIISGSNSSLSNPYQWRN